MAGQPTAWLETVPELAQLSAEDRALLLVRSQVLVLPPGQTVFAPGQPAESFLLLLKGTVKVQQVSPGGREIVLYRVSGGESCIMTTACLLSHDGYAAEGVTETSVEAVALPQEAFDLLLARSPDFRRFVFTDYARRIHDLMQVVEEVAFERIDKRLAQKLIARAGAADLVTGTHQDLAIELGSAREVVSRHLKELQRRGLVELSRGQIALLDRPGLEALAAAD